MAKPKLKSKLDWIRAFPYLFPTALDEVRWSLSSLSKKTKLAKLSKSGHKPKRLG